MLKYGQNSTGINQKHKKPTGKPSHWNFIDLMLHGPFTALLIIECIKDTGHKGRVVQGARVWTHDEAEAICKLATSTLDGSRYA